MQNTDNKAVDAIWKTQLKDANEKLVLYHLVTKHELGDRYSSSWKSIEQFLNDFDTKWFSPKELQMGTQLSSVKVERTLKELMNRNLVESSEIPAKLNKREDNPNKTQTIYAITSKLFEDYKAASSKNQAASA